MNEVKTGWTHATKSISEAMVGFVSCMEAGLNAWIELRDNGDQDFPIMIPNPELDNPFNWEMLYGTVRDEKSLKSHKYLNAMERDLTYNWTAGYGTSEAIEKYKETGEITEGLLSNAGISFPIRIKDAEEYRRTFMDNDYKYGYFVTFWTPKKGVKVHVTDPSVGKVFTVCYTEDPVNKSTAARRAAEFLLAYADRLDGKEK